MVFNFESISRKEEIQFERLIELSGPWTNLTVLWRGVRMGFDSAKPVTAVWQAPSIVSAFRLSD
jgi:hypothetical protein